MKTTIVHLPLHQFSSHSACMKKCYVVGHTKHYYLGQERVATGLGEGGWMSAVKPFEQDEAYTLIRPFFQHFNTDLPCEKYPETQNLDILGERPQELQYGCHPACLTRLGLAFKPDYLQECIGSNISTSGEATELFFTHSNHLGSASWITDKTATPVQYIHYAPYGELLANQIAIGYDERYKFTGKERDAESGYDFYGARYLGSALGHWLSVDQLADKYPGMSPYAYCAWNPIKYIDPDGQENVVAFPKKDVTPGIQKAINKFPVNTEVIHFWAHGASNTIRVGVPDSDNETYINDPGDFYLFLTSNSALWQEHKDGDPAIIVLHACSTGKGENSIAQQISESPLFKNVIIVAPSAVDVIVDGVEQGPAAPNNTEELGEWRMFLNGKLVNSFAGGSIPIFNNPENHVNRYLSDERQ